MTGERRLGAETRAAIGGASDVYVSVASIWEVAIKSSLGRLDLPTGFDPVLEIEREGFQMLRIEGIHANGVRALPYHHPDPFDRLLISQAHLEGLTIVTADSWIAKYDIQMLEAER